MQFLQHNALEKPSTGTSQIRLKTMTIPTSSIDVKGALSPENLHYILRLTVLIGGYMLLRPLIEMGFRRLFSSRDQVQQPPQPPRQKSLADEIVVEDDVEVEDDASASGLGVDGTTTDQGEWGSRLRRRQQSKFMEYWEAEQARRAEVEDLADIEDMLED